MTLFRPGDLAVYPTYGVGKIQSIESRSMGESQIDCYVVSILSNNSKVFVPIDTAEQMGLRTLITSDVAGQVYECFKKHNPDLLKMNWNKRYRSLQDKMKTGRVEDVAGVISDLMFLKKKKGLSYGEERLLNDAQEILATELSITENVPKDDVLARIRESF